MYCKNCGNELSDREKFCTKCGAPAEEPTIQNGEKASQYAAQNVRRETRPEPPGTAAGSQTSRAAILIAALAGAGVILVAGLGVTMFFVFHQGTPAGAAVMEEASTGEQTAPPASSPSIAPSPSPSPSPSPLPTPSPSRESEITPTPILSQEPTSSFTVAADVDVAYLQQLLIRLGYGEVRENGEFDSETQQAVADCLQSDGGSIYGLVDQAAEQQIYSKLQQARGLSECTSETQAVTELYPEPQQEISYDPDVPYEGEEVKYVQAALIEMNYDGVNVTGVFDQSTQFALMRFQKNHGYDQTGVVTVESVPKIYNAVVIWRAKTGK